jgi:hypothetical protein
VWFIRLLRRYRYGRACERKRNGRPAQGSKFWVSRSLVMTVGLFPLPDPQSAFAPIADGEAEIGMLVQP